MDLGIQGKTALVLGGAGGLRSAIATVLAREGALVVVADRDADALQIVEQRLNDAKGRCLSIEWDLADLDAIDRHVSTIESRFGQVDILVNNTGGPPPSAAWGLEPAVWREHFEKMVQPPIAITDRVLPGMRRKRWGAHHHERIVGRDCANSQSGRLERSPLDAGGLIENACARSWCRRYHGEYGRAGTNRHRAH